MFSSFHTTPTTAIYTLSLHDALPISVNQSEIEMGTLAMTKAQNDQVKDYAKKLVDDHQKADDKDRKSTRLNSSHEWISYAVFCLKKKRNSKTRHRKPLPSLMTGAADI